MRIRPLFLLIIPLLFLATHPIVLNKSYPETQKQLFDFGWKFKGGENPGAEALDYNDQAWEQVDLPHDWSIEGPFSQDNPSFSRGGWLPTGKCTYRKTFELPNSQKDQRFVIYFDGAYRNSEVWINGHFLGKRPLGYTAFHYDMTEHLNFGGPNTLTVRLDNSEQPGSRWYTGTGIYRHVYLIRTNKLYIPVWGNYMVANDYDKGQAVIQLETQIQNDLPNQQQAIIRYSVNAPNGQLVQTKDIPFLISSGAKKTVKAELEISNPQLWDIQKPNLYTVQTSILDKEGKLIYTEHAQTGIRKLSFDPNTGFHLNGKAIKLKGVCLHHDGGPLGAAVYERTIERQLEKLREMGCNAVRTAHNPFSEEFLDVCDRMGFLVMNEMFDEWELPKSPATTQNGKKIRIPIDFYARVFNDWAETDLTDFILRDRNHPSVIMWSIGNEIEQMMKDEGAPIAKRLAKIVHQLDYRPVTNGVYGYGWNRWPSDLAVATSDIKGYNYIKEDGFEKERGLFPNAMAIVTECKSAQSFYPRETYLYGKVKEAWWQHLNYEHQEAFEWAESMGLTGDAGIEAWKAVKKRPYVMGQFIWTGWDYLGEVIPFGWPARSSSFGVIDLCGFPKDGYYFYQSQWSEQPMVHIFPHWNLDGQEGNTVKVYTFTNGDAVELFQDGQSLGKQINHPDSVTYQSWDVVYQPGSLKAIAYKGNQPIAEKTVHTAGAPSMIQLTVNRKRMQANGQDLIYIECAVLDETGNIVPVANNLLEFEIQGPATLAGVGNGNNFSHEPFQANTRKAFNGKCLAIIRSTPNAGTIRFVAKSNGLKPAVIDLISN